ncbi:YtpI family protein [Cohnella sp. GCM10027633]|uniref:YtpI family protein n=1 Tax=unclassified Cohnella TaxID=2636738 RepID=UPI00363C8046
MDNALQIILALLVVATLALSAFYSFKSRRTADGRWRGLFASRMNINMGLMLIFLSILLLTMFSGSSVRVVVSSLFLLLGLFNLFAGIRNRSHYSRLLEQQQSR